MPSGFLQELVSKGVEIHARSAFLQGLALLHFEEIPHHLAGLSAQVKIFHEECQAKGLSPLAAALLFLRQNEFVGAAVVGAQNAQQIKEITQAFASDKDIKLAWPKYACDNFDLVTPSCWNNLKKEKTA